MAGRTRYRHEPGIRCSASPRAAVACTIGVGPGGRDAAGPCGPRTWVQPARQRGRTEPAVRCHRVYLVRSHLCDSWGAGGVTSAGNPVGWLLLGSALAYTLAGRSCQVYRHSRPDWAAALQRGAGAGFPDAAAVPDRLAALTQVAVGGLADHASLPSMYSLPITSLPRPSGTELPVPWAGSLGPMVWVWAGEGVYGRPNCGARHKARWMAEQPAVRSQRGPGALRVAGSEGLGCSKALRPRRMALLGAQRVRWAQPRNCPARPERHRVSDEDH